MKTVAQMLHAKSSQDVHTITPEATVLDALWLMAECNVGALPVCDEQGRLVGIFSERDYARKGVLLGRSSIGTQVREVMSTPVLTVVARQGIRECMELMTEKRLRHLPVLQQGRLIGLISIGDLVKEIMSAQQAQINQLEQYIRGE